MDGTTGGASDGVGFGYNVKNVEKLIVQIGETIPKIKAAMSDPWPTLSNIMSTEWIGPDEIAAEADFADAMEELFVSCQGIVVESQINLAQSAEG